MRNEIIGGRLSINAHIPDRIGDAIGVLYALHFLPLEKE